MSKQPKPEAIFIADLHLQHNPPILRSKEPDWYQAMARPLRELRRLKRKCGNVPVFCAGDVFTYWKAPPELINFALAELPNMYSIPGQHDLPNHSIIQIHRSAYDTLVRSGRLDDWWTSSDGPDVSRLYESDAFDLVGIPYGQKLFACDPAAWEESGREDCLRIAMQHKYVWVPGSTVPGTNTTNTISDDLKCNWDMLVYGDNHAPYAGRQTGNTLLVNCGTVMRRLLPELKYKPMATILHNDHSLEYYYFDTSLDVYWEQCREVEDAIRQADPELCKAVAKGLEGLQEAGLDFRQYLEKYFEQLKVAHHVFAPVLKALDEVCNEE